MDNKLVFWDIVRSGSGAAATSKMECFAIIVNGFTKRSILDVAAALDPPLIVDQGKMRSYCSFASLKSSRKLDVHHTFLTISD